MENTEQAITRHSTQVELLLSCPDEIFADADVTLQVKVMCDEKCNLQGSQVSILNEEGMSVTDIDLINFDGEGNLTDEFTVKVPAVTGLYIWKANFITNEGEEISHESSTTSFSFTVIPHHISITVWGVPIPVQQENEFVVKVGAKCSAGCSLAELPFTVHNHEGVLAGSGFLGDEPLPQTSGVFWTEQMLTAPGVEGLSTWTVDCTALELELPHKVSSASFKLKTERDPNQTVTVVVTDARKGQPLKGASVYIHPYRSNTDEKGEAKLQVTDGNHTLYIKLQDYTDFQTDLQVDGDIEVTAVLSYSPDPFA